MNADDMLNAGILAAHRSGAELVRFLMDMPNRMAYYTVNKPLFGEIEVSMAFQMLDYLGVKEAPIKLAYSIDSEEGRMRWDRERPPTYAE